MVHLLETTHNARFIALMDMKNVSKPSARKFWPRRRSSWPVRKQLSKRERKA
jgi:hypothetical protein